MKRSSIPSSTFLEATAQVESKKSKSQKISKTKTSLTFVTDKQQDEVIQNQSQKNLSNFNSIIREENEKSLMEETSKRINCSVESLKNVSQRKSKQINSSSMRNSNSHIHFNQTENSLNDSKQISNANEEEIDLEKSVKNTVSQKIIFRCQLLNMQNTKLRDFSIKQTKNQSGKSPIQIREHIVIPLNNADLSKSNKTNGEVCEASLSEEFHNSTQDPDISETSPTLLASKPSLSAETNTSHDSFDQRKTLDLDLTKKSDKMEETLNEMQENNIPNFTAESNANGFDDSSIMMVDDDDEEDDQLEEEDDDDNEESEVIDLNETENGKMYFFL